MLKISKRLCTVAQYVRDGAVVADIGTDHAYLPIYLAEQGKIKRAVASDINKGPLEKAKENIHNYGYDEIIDACLANGLAHINEYNPTDIAICGMGGELIAQILDASDYVKKEGVRLILQPMTSARELREYLSKGYFTIAENIVFEDGKLYQIICAEYDGKEKHYTDAELELGVRNIENGGEMYEKLLFSTIAKKQKKLDGQRLGGQNADETEKELQELLKLKEKLSK